MGIFCNKSQSTNTKASDDNNHKMMLELILLLWKPSFPSSLPQNDLAFCMPTFQFKLFACLLASLVKIKFICQLSCLQQEIKLP